MSQHQQTTTMQPDVVWNHRPGNPGYYVSADGLYQTLVDDNGAFLICKMEAEETEDGEGFEIVAGPVATLEELGVPEELVAEGDKMMIADIAARAKRGEKVSLILGGDLGVTD